jgi:DNA-binding response OmpR family regulator
MDNLVDMPPLKILVVEDDPDGGSIVAEILREDGHDVRLAQDGASALAMARASTIDAVLLDLHLPDLIGYEVARCLREGILPESSTIILVTGDTTAELDRANVIGIDIVLHKPYEAVVLGRLIEFVRTRRRRKFSLSPLRVSTK